MSVMDNEGHLCTFTPFLLTKQKITNEKEFDYTLFFVIPAVSGLIVNALVLTLVCCNRKLRTKPFLFLISISAADAVFPLYGALKALDKKFDMVRNPTQIPNLASLKPACWITGHLEIAVQSTVVLSLVAVSFERCTIVHHISFVCKKLNSCCRFVVICKPLKARDILTRKRCRYFIAVIWILSFSLGFMKPMNTVSISIFNSS